MSALQIKDFHFLKIIGSGVNSKVFVAERDNNVYVIKAAYKRRSRVTDFGVTEKNILEKIKHSFVIQMMGCFTTTNYLCYVLEFAAGGDMMYHLKTSGGTLAEDAVQFYTAEASLAINFLHSNGIIHRDIKLRNILISKEGHIKLTDFGSSTEVHLEGIVNTVVGTQKYMAPEVTKGELYSYEVDWWSLGICVYIMLYGKAPINELGISSFSKLVVGNSQSTEIIFPEIISSSAASFLKGLLKKTPNERLGKAGFHDILSHEFFTNIEWAKLEAKEVKPPFIPHLGNPRDLRHFDPYHIREPYSLTKIPQPFAQPMSAFEDFNYINPNWKNEV